MFACCPLCYEKYINEDGTTDLEALVELLKKFTFKEKMSILKGLCDCPCHVKGEAVIH